MAAASTSLQAAAATKQAGALKEAGAALQTSVNTVQALGEVADRAARDYGMRNCGQAGAAPRGSTNRRQMDSDLG